MLWFFPGRQENQWIVLWLVTRLLELNDNLS